LYLKIISVGHMWSAPVVGMAVRRNISFNTTWKYLIYMSRVFGFAPISIRKFEKYEFNWTWMFYSLALSIVTFLFVPSAIRFQEITVGFLIFDARRLLEGFSALVHHCFLIYHGKKFAYLLNGLPLNTLHKIRTVYSLILAGLTLFLVAGVMNVFDAIHAFKIYRVSLFNAVLRGFIDICGLSTMLSDIVFATFVIATKEELVVLNHDARRPNMSTFPRSFLSNYVKLTNRTVILNQVFGFPILVSMLLSFVQITSCLFLVITKNVDTFKGIFLSWMITFQLVKVTMKLSVCELASREVSILGAFYRFFYKYA